MKITYNLQVLPQRKNSRKDSEETTALKAFLADSEKKNMVFEYDTPQEAKKRYDSMRNYRVRAKDSKAAYSAYTTSPTRTVTHNVDPTVSGSDQQLGVVTTPPSFQYTVNDGDAGDTLTIVESLDGVTLNTITPAERNHQYTFALTAAQFAALTGPHTMTIKVSDSAGNSVTRTITFTRSVSIIDFDWKVDDTSAAAQKILVSMRYNAHEDGVTIQVCNNYNDEEPTWETAQLGLKHIFSNSAKTADSFAVGVRVQITKVGGYESIACYSLSASYI